MSMKWPQGSSTPEFPALGWEDDLFSVYASFSHFQSGDTSSSSQTAEGQRNNAYEMVGMEIWALTFTATTLSVLLEDGSSC